MKKYILVIVLLSVFHVDAAEQANLSTSKVGKEILVNTQTLFDQTLAQSAKLNDGGFVTVWVDWADSTNTKAADGSWSGIKAQIFSATGTKIGAEITVNTAIDNWQQDPHVAVLQDGNFVVTWTDGWDYFSYADHPGSLGVGGAQGDKEAKSIKAQVFSASGIPIGTEILVNTETRSSQTAEKITALHNGNFIIVWEDWSISCVYDADGSLNRCGGGPGIKAQIFDPKGTKIGKELALTADYNYGPQIAALANGGFVVAWQDGHYSVEDIIAQVYNDSGAKVGQQALVNTFGTGTSFSTQNEHQVIALNNGGYAVTWTDKNGDVSGYGVKVQVFNASGTKVGTETLANTTTQSNQYHPQSAALKNGGFIVAWDDWSSDNDVQAQVFDNMGAKVGTEILVNTTKGGSQDGNRIAALDDGGFVASWIEGWTDVKYQVFDAAGAKVGVEALANTTTAGGQTGAQPLGLAGSSFLIAWNDNLYGPSDGSGAAVKAQLFSKGQSVTPEDCLFNWAETNYALFFAPAATTQTFPPYSYRYYKNTHAYLGVSAKDSHVYYITPEGKMLDAGTTSYWYGLSKCL